jgi:hypothetical protein
MWRLELNNLSPPQTQMKVVDVVGDGGFINPTFYSVISSIFQRTQADSYLCLGAPAAGLGDVGDFALDLVALNVYKKTPTGWGAPSALGNSVGTAYKLPKQAV